MRDLAYRVSELERLLANLLRVGTVDSLDAPNAKVRVKIGDLTTAALPWFTRRAGADRDWWAPSVGEQVMVLSPGGDLSQGVALPALNRTAYPAPASSADKHRVDYADGGFSEYDRSTGALTISAEALATLIGKGTIEFKGAASAPVKGIVQGDCLCVVTGAPHPMISATVKGSL
jgi:phage baseplate assembly protein V